MTNTPQEEHQNPAGEYHFGLDHNEVIQGEDWSIWANPNPTLEIIEEQAVDHLRQCPYPLEEAQAVQSATDVSLEFQEVKLCDLPNDRTTFKELMKKPEWKSSESAILPLLEVLNLKLNCVTTDSCSGHGHPNGCAYVRYAAPSLEQGIKILNILRKNAIERVRWFGNMHVQEIVDLPEGKIELKGFPLFYFQVDPETAAETFRKAAAELEKLAHAA